jgi:hypothetical protein
MVYGNDSSSSNLKPILLVVSLLSMILFGCMYGFYMSSQARETPDASAVQPTSASGITAAAASPVLQKAVAAKPKMRSRV